ncbi:interleukin-21 isoform X2 [Gasterosteus aculeatus]|uniref:Uncharacterized protein n=1 Tax=Gasterosteus aculeatus aculeatus TaxID=481459 RepID=A0AAQ4PBX7_GASAC
MKMGSGVFLLGALERLYVRTYRVPRRRGLTTLSYHVVATAGGKECVITHSRQFLQISKWFSCVLRDEYKTAWCGSLVGASTSRPTTRPPMFRRKLEEVLGHLHRVKESQQHNEKTLNIPPQSFKDRCCVSTLKYFLENLEKQFNASQDKLYRSLKQRKTERALCPSGDIQANCQTYNSHPGTVQVFFERLQSFIEEGITRLSMK